MKEDNYIGSELKNAESAVVVKILPKRKSMRFFRSNIVALIALALSAVSAFLSFSDLSESVTSNSLSKIQQSLFDQPEDVQSLIQQARQSSVTIYCAEGSGSGWGIDLQNVSQNSEFEGQSFEIVTNYHVIQDCIMGGKVRFSIGDSLRVHDASIFGFGSNERDLALLVTSTLVPSLPPAGSRPEIGNWVMAVGSPGVSAQSGLLKGNVTFGHVTSLVGNLVVTDAAVNFGNSGGPLVNSRGQVIGTNTWVESKETTDNIAYAQGTPVLCEVILDCDGSYLNWIN